MSKPPRRHASRTAADRRRAALVADFSAFAHQALSLSLTQLGNTAITDHVALTTPRGAMPIAPEVLAKVHADSEPERRILLGLYERCLARYRSIVGPQSLPDIDDVGMAAARFAAACFQALQGIEVTHAMLLRLEHQLVAIVRASPAWSSARADARQLCFEHLAIFAVLIPQSAARATPGDTQALAEVRGAARRNLQALLGLNPDAVTLGANGLMVAPAALVTAAAAAL